MTGPELVKFIQDFKEKNQFIPSLERDYTPVYEAQAKFREYFDNMRKQELEKMKE